MAKRSAALHAGEIQVVDVQRLPRGVGRRAVVIDAVALPPLEYGQIAAHARAGVPIEAAFVGPGALRAQIGIAEIGGSE